MVFGRLNFFIFRVLVVGVYVGGYLFLFCRSSYRYCSSGRVDGGFIEFLVFKGEGVGVVSIYYFSSFVYWV